MPSQAHIQHIVCAVRGIPQSRETVTKAIDLALEHKARLTFIGITQADFIMSAAPTMISLKSVYKQLRNLSEFTMLILCDRAQRRGVQEVDFTIREGDFLSELYAYLAQARPDLLVMGKPAETSAEVSGFSASEYQEFTEKVANTLRIPIIPVDIPQSP